MRCTLDVQVQVHYQSGHYQETYVVVRQGLFLTVFCKKKHVADDSMISNYLYPYMITNKPQCTIIYKSRLQTGCKVTCELWEVAGKLPIYITVTDNRIAYDWAFPEFTATYVKPVLKLYFSDAKLT